MESSKAKYSAFDTAVYYLTFKGRTKKEVYDKLKEKGYCSSEIDASISKLEEYGYIDDESYTLSYIKGNLSKKGKKRIKMELLQKGINKTIVESGLEEMTGNEDDVVEEIFRRRFSSINCSEPKEQRRVFSYFARRGFRHESIRKILNSYGKDTKNYELL